ncbi:MAG: hypothetical protein JRG73_08140 [Deltaproteobacteria bacterium]|nr:hypothetical protein [Deltaproteobacteria bacterium]MBW2306890.1 hypothetical protein [Deltaproteobacteria bacterium]
MIKIFDPTAGPATGKLVLMDRLRTLNGKKLAVLWNGRTHGDKILRRVLDLLKEKYAFEVVDFLKKPYIGNIAPKEYFDRIFNDKADAAIVGIGD